MNFRNMITCVMTAMMMTMPYLGCVVGFRRSPPPSFDEGEWRRRRQVRRAYAKRCRARSNHTLSPNVRIQGLTQYDAVHDSVSPDSAGERVVGGHETPQ
jgi:hypothetical protein